MTDALIARPPSFGGAGRPEPVVRLSQAAAGYGGAPVLHDIDLTIRHGERVALMGRSGAGKSTLIGVLYDALAGRAALIPQAASLVRALSVFHNVYMGRLDRRSTARNLWTLVRPAKADVAEIAATLATVEMAEKLFEKAGALSGGQQQRVSVARALYDGRPILIGDEPVSALDRRQGAAVLETLGARHPTTILAMHDAALALGHADRIVVLDAGRIVLDRPSRDLGPADLAPFFEV